MIPAEPLTIAVGADDRYAVGLAVALWSAVANCSSRAMDCVVLDMGMSNRSRSKIEGAVRRAPGIRDTQVRILWLDPGSRLSLLPEVQHFSRAAYLRLLLGDILPDRQRCIYLDSDVLVRGDLQTLWTVNLGAGGLAAVEGRAGPRVAEYMKRFRGPGSLDARYFYSGILLIDLDVFRRENILERAADFCIDHQADLRFPDQDALNVLFADRWIALDPDWNVIVKPDRPLDRQTAKILHFAGAIKPWRGAYRPDTLEGKLAHREYLTALFATRMITGIARLWLCVRTGYFPWIG